MSGPTVLLTGAGGSASANVLDALRLSGRGYRVIGADASPVNLHLSHADARAVIPRPSDAGFADALNALIADHRVDMLHPQPDPDVLAIGVLRHSLGARTYLPEQDALQLVADKSEFAAALTRAGVAVPESVDFDSVDDVASRVRELLTRHGREWL